MSIKTGNMKESPRPAGPFEHVSLQVAGGLIDDRLRAAHREKLDARAESRSAGRGKRGEIGARAAGRVRLGLTMSAGGRAHEAEGE
jgi:hypothetical protein